MTEARKRSYLRAGRVKTANHDI